MKGLFPGERRMNASIWGVFERFALDLVGLERHLRKQLRETRSPLRFYLPLTTKSTFEEAWEAAELLNGEWDLGECPARRLHVEIENRLNATVLMVDAPDPVSGGAVNLPSGATIFINRNHSKGRRNFTLAHELFHILTWETLPPKKVDLEEANSKTRVERLANNFAGALLMPHRVLDQKAGIMRGMYGNDQLSNQFRASFHSWIRETAEFFQVSAQALKYRLINLELLPKEVFEQWADDFMEDLVAARQFGKKFPGTGE
jgi:hypothetical protein